MRKLLLLILSTALSMEGYCLSASSDTLRIITYNVWVGFDWSDDTERMDSFVNYINGEAPDVVAMQELNGFTYSTLAKLAARWGHNNVAIVKKEGFPVGITSSQPITVVEKLVEGYGHGLLHVQTHGYDMLVTHLNPANWETRLSEANNIVAYMQEKGLKERTIIMGDFNANSPYDAAVMAECNMDLLTNNTESVTNFIDGYFDYSVISRFLSYPLLDPCQRFVNQYHRETYPTPILWDRDKPLQGRVTQRIDYIFITPDLMDNVADIFIRNQGVVDYLSDHYPVTMDLVVD